MSAASRRGVAVEGVDVLLDAFARLRRQVPNARLALVGEGDDASSYEARARDLGIAQAITFRGVLGGAALVDAFQRASVVVLPSLTEAESFGMVLIEAMACGTPVVAS